MLIKEAFWKNFQWILSLPLLRFIIKKLSPYLAANKKALPLDTQKAILEPQTSSNLLKIPQSLRLRGELSSLYSLSPKSLSGLDRLDSKEVYENFDITWRCYRDDLEIHAPLLEKGILAVRTACMNPSQQSPSPNADFSLSSRILSFCNSKDITHANKTVTLLRNLTAFCEPECTLNDENQYTVIHNKARREELFLPLVIKDSNGKQLGFYTYPWLSSNKTNVEFLGFEEFVVAGCIFGSSLMAQDQNNLSFPLIKHGIKFFPTQKILSIKCHLKIFGPYERMLFSEFEKQTLLMKKFEKKDKKIRLRYHLPYYDYILFGVELFGRGRISLVALNSFFEAVFIRKAQYEQEIRRICKIQDISVTIESPFENIFGTLPETKQYTKFIFEKLALSGEETEPQLDEKLQDENEQKLVKHCSSQLITNIQREDHRQIWDSLIKIQKTPLNNLEQLFKLANGVMIALACTGKKDYETCSLLPLSEKQIQLSFQKLNRELNNQYPAVVNLTTLDTLIAYDNNNDNSNSGLLFYFSACQSTLNKLITKEKLLDRAHENIGHYIKQEKTINTEKKPKIQKKG